jgi:RNA polymerase sigma factor (sigma-70 family)
MPAAQAVEALVHEYGRLIFHTIYGLTGDWEESLDLTQHTFLQALKSIDAVRFKSDRAFHAKAWLLSIALNAVRKQRRRHSLFRFIPFSHIQREEQQEKGYEADLDILNSYAAPLQPGGYGATESVNPESLVTERDAVQRTMARISEPLRICLLLSVIGNFSTAEIASMLDLEEAAVRQRLARAKKQFQQFYALESGEEATTAILPNEGLKANENLKNSKQTGKYTGKQQDSVERVETQLSAEESQPTQRRKYAERLSGNPAITSLW